MLLRRAAVATLAMASTMVIAACSEDAYYGDPAPATGRGRGVALVGFLILLIPTAAGGAGLTWLHRSARAGRARPAGSVRMAGAWYLALAALCGLPGVYFLIGFASKALIGLASVGRERRFVDYEALLSGLVGLCSLLTAILLATVGMGLLRAGGGYRWAAAACSGLLFGLGVTLAVAGVGQDTASPLIAGAVLVVAAAGPVPMLFWGGAGDQEQ